MLVDALLIGLLAGLAVAMPLGAIGVLLVQEGIARGWASAAASATGVALVDLCYAATAVTAGSAVSGLLADRVRAVHVIAATVLIGIAVRGLANTVRAVRTGTGRNGTAGGPTAPTAGGPAGGRGPLGALLRFAALTAVNPLTAVYFVALAAGLDRAVSGTGRATAFVLGVFVASWGWQLCLATVGAVLGDRLGGRTRTLTGLVGYLVILWYAGRLAYR